MLNKKRSFKGMSYRNLQLDNSQKRLKIHQEDQIWLKANGYKNIGWDNVIRLYEKIEEFLSRYQFEDLTLEELFLEADRIGNKYLSSQEIAEFNQKLTIEVNEISEELDKQFPENKVEFIDYSKKNHNKNKTRKNRSY